MPAKVFISYRRDDSKYQARMIYGAFCQVVPHENVFMDVDSIPPGANFRKILKGWVDECEVLLALIGPGWIDATDPKTGQRRLNNPSDFVRIEISEALARAIPVVPVLLDGTPMPDVDLLPDDMKALVDRQAEFLEYRTFDHDMARLIKKLGFSRTAPSATTSAAFGTTQRSRPNDERMRAEGRILVDAAIVQNANDAWFKPGAGKTEWFKDCEQGPEMVIVPAGNFTMGSTEDESSDYKGDRPQHNVTIGRPFAVGRFAVTFDEWDASVADGGSKAYSPPDQGWGRGRRPVIGVSWNDATTYVAWLFKTTGKTYRLITEAEWEYAARAGTTTPFWWGSSISMSEANYKPNGTWGGGPEGEGRQVTVKVDTFSPNPFGLYNVHGNVWEWVEDWFALGYNGAPTDGSASTAAGSLRGLRGGSWYDPPWMLRSANRFAAEPTAASSTIGLRVARTLDP